MDNITHVSYLLILPLLENNEFVKITFFVYSFVFQDALLSVENDSNMVMNIF